MNAPPLLPLNPRSGGPWPFHQGLHPQTPYAFGLIPFHPLKKFEMKILLNEKLKKIGKSFSHTFQNIANILG